MEQKAESGVKAVAVDALYHPASVEAAPRPAASIRNSSSTSNTSTQASKVLVNATILSADTPAAPAAQADVLSVSDVLSAPALLTEEQQKGLAAAAEASMDAVQKAEVAQQAKNLADPLRKLQIETKDAVLKARDELQTHESSAFTASVKAKEAELEAEMLGKAVAMARESANARRESASSSVVRAAERHAAAQEAGREATSAQEESKRALASSTKVAVAKAALDRSKVALSSPAASNSSAAAKADVEAKQAQAKAQSMAMEAAKARQASADKSVEAPSSRHS